MRLKEKNIAPEFELSDQNGNIHALPIKDEWTLIYFYPKDDTPGCAKEACAVRDLASEYAKAGLKVFGVSPDSVHSHGQFADKYGLAFPLLADEDKEVVKLYGSWGRKTYKGKEYMGVKRLSFLIGPNGRVAKAYLNVKPEEHASEVLQDLQMIRSGDP